MADQPNRAITVEKNGRICIPADLRRQLGVAKGGTLVLEVRDDALVLSTADQAIRRARKAVEHLFEKPEASMDAFLAERNREAAAEADDGNMAA